MSFTDAIRRFFKPTPEEKAQKLRKKIINMYCNPEDRKYALGQLHDLGPEVAPKVLIERFTCHCENGTVDADEKAYTKDLLLNLGDACIEPLETYLRNNDKDFSWPYRTLSELLPHDELVKFVIELLNSIGPSYVRDPERKEQLILTVKSFTEKEVALATLPYLADDNETIRFVAADTVMAHKLPEGIAALSERLGKETSQRVLTLIATAFRDKGWRVTPECKEAAAKNLPDGFRINDKGAIV